MNLEPQQIAEIARLYHELQSNIDELDASLFQGPNGIAGQTHARYQLICDTVQRYTSAVPREVQHELGIDVEKLEAMLGQSQNHASTSATSSTPHTG